MSQLFSGLAVLACPVGMGLMMWMMMRGGKSTNQTPPADAQVTRLRAELDQLKAAQRDRSPQGSSDAPKPW